MNKRTVVLLVVAALLVLQQAVPDVAVQLAAGGASPWLFIALRAGSFAIGLLLAITDPTGTVRAVLEATMAAVAAATAASRVVAVPAPVVAAAPEVPLAPVPAAPVVMPSADGVAEGVVAGA